MRIGIFEDKSFETLQPLTLLRPTFDLRCGILLLGEKIELYFPDLPCDYFARHDLLQMLREKDATRDYNSMQNDDYLFLNGSALFNAGELERLNVFGHSAVFIANEKVIAAKIMRADLNGVSFDERGLINFTGLERQELTSGSCDYLQYPWNFVHHNAAQIEADFKYFTDQKADVQKFSGVFFVNPDNIAIAESAKIDPGVVIDATDGPVFIDQQAHVFPQATIIGPAFIGKNSSIKIGAKIYEGTSIGEVCKVGGEVEESIIHSYSNKQHDGFLGHAYLGQWVNLGADTNNSDLKNNYSSVRVSVNGKEVDSGSMFVGLTMGDHSKSAINTMFNTGTVVGMMGNVFGAGFPPKWIPDFTWGGAEGLVEFKIEKALEVARKVMQRRKMELGPEEEKLIRKRFTQTAVLREKAGIKSS